MPFAVGDKLGPYEIVASLGAGGMGEVWKARDTRLDRIVAIKRLKPQHTARFQQEARAIAALNHPHICQIYDVGPDYLVLEYVDGSPLRGPLKTEEAVRLAIQIASALEVAHQQGILHRDLKPGNVLTTRSGAKLLDFGLAKMVTLSDMDATKTVEGTILGTPSYMSPEQAQGKPLDERSDLFSFGAVLYEMFSGRRAFSGEHAISTLGAVIHKEPEPLQAPPDVARIVTRCLRKSPAERFQSAAELRVALESTRISPPPADHPSIAVLPFANMSGDQDQEYFSDGLAEEIINALAQIPGLKVTARTSAFAFRGKEQDIRKIAEALDVRTILEGSVRRSGNRIRVTAQLINAQDGYHLWSQRYDRELVDVFEVQDEIAAAIAGALEVKLMPMPAERYKPNLPAYEALLEARHIASKPTPQAQALAKEYYQKAIDLDPKFALAYAELGTLFLTLGVFGFRPPQELLPEVRALAQQALDLDPLLPEAHALLACVAAQWEYDWKEAARRFKLAAVRTASRWVRLLNMIYLLIVGSTREALEQGQTMLQEDPLFLMGRAYVGMCLWAAGREDSALREWKHVLDLDESSDIVYRLLAMFHASRGEFAEALRNAERAYSLPPRAPVSAGLLAGLLARTGDSARAAELINKLGPPETYGVPRAHAWFHLALGETEPAVDWHEKMIDQRDNAATAVTHIPFGAPIRSSPRWPTLAKRMNLPG
jgi:serine/threonine-protein kinase